MFATRFITRATLVLAASRFAVAGDAPLNLARNVGFETPGQNNLPADWSGVTDVYSRDTTVKRSGEASLKFVNPKADRYVLCSQGVPLQPGRMYEVSAWVKTQGIAGEDSGATVCLEWHGEKGEYLGGCYPAGVKGDKDWTHIKAVSGRVSEGARGVSVSCYVRQHMTGTAWWDDVQVIPVREHPFSSVLLVPNYRGRITEAGPEKIVIRACLALRDYNLTPADVAVTWAIRNDQKQIAQGEVSDILAAETDIAIPTKDLPPGPHEIALALTEKRSGKTLATAAHRVVRCPEDNRRVACIDAHNRLIVGGKPFFPLGTYWGSINEKEIAVYADSPFNCLMPYGMPSKEQLDLAHEHGLKVIYSVKDTYFGTDANQPEIKCIEDEEIFVRKKVEAFRDHPAVLAWYLNDELPLEKLDRLKAHQRWIEEWDPGHPTWVVLYQVDQIRQYIDTFDVIGTDPYPIPKLRPAVAGEWTRKTVGGVCGARPVWQVPQIFNWANYHKTEAEKAELRPPTLEEMRSMAWQCIAEGANGLVFYSFFDVRRDKARPFDQHWPLVKTMAGEIKDMFPVLLSVEAPPSIRAASAPWLHWLVKQLGPTTFLVAVNDSREPQTTGFTLPSRPAKILRRGTEQAIAVDAQNRLAVTMNPLDVQIYEIEGLAKK